MRLFVFISCLLALSTAVLAGDGKSPAKKPPPPPGIWWADDVKTGLERAMREGRPVLFAINALENERANNQLATASYRSRTWGEATRGYVALVCNPNDHTALGGTGCGRYPGTTCSSHKGALTWFTKRFGESLISPQHVILEPDGDVAFRKEYYTGVVTPTLLEGHLSSIAPRIAYARAGIGREQRIEALGKLPLEELPATASAWLTSADGLAAAALINALDDSYDKPRRLALIAAMRKTPKLQVPVLVHAAEERVLYPADEPAETRAWIRTLFAADRRAGIWAATRALVRMESEQERGAVLRMWAGTAPDAPSPGIADLPIEERPFAYEALILARDRRAVPAEVPADWKRGRELEILRALERVGRTTVARDMLREVLSKDAPAGILRANLLRASPEAVRKAAKDVVKAFVHSPSARVRIAAAVALLRAQLPQKGTVAATILAALDDPLEGPDVRAQAIRILGGDPGPSRAAWANALAEHLAGGAK